MINVLSLPRCGAFLRGRDSHCHANAARTITSSKMQLVPFSIILFTLQMQMNVQVLKQTVVTQTLCVPTLGALMFVAV